MQSRRKYIREAVIVLLVTLGMSGIRSVLQLVASLSRPLNEQSVTLNAPQSDVAWTNVALQLTSVATLVAWGLLVLYLLDDWPRPSWRDVLPGAGLAAIIGLPGLALYVVALQAGWTKEVVISGSAVSLLWAFGNAFAEETIVVKYLYDRFGPARSGPAWGVLILAAVLRGSYHLYQGVSAFFGNAAMGLIYGYYYHRTRRVWPLIFGHFLIDAVAFVGYPLLHS